MTKRKLRKWKMWAVCDRLNPEQWTPRLFFERQSAREYQQSAGWLVLRVEVLELPRKKR